MKKKWAAFLVLLSLSGLSVVFNIEKVSAHENYYIKSDGSVEPSTDLIELNGNVYTLKGNIEGTLVVEVDNVVLDGAGYTLQGPEPADQGEVNYSYGVQMQDRNNVTVKNFLVNNYDFGIWQKNSTNNVITQNTITNCSVRGIYLRDESDRAESTNNTIYKNFITGGEQGIALDPCLRNIVAENFITKTTYALSITGVLRCIFSGNIVINNKYGIWLVDSHNVFTNNTMKDNEQNFCVFSSSKTTDSHHYTSYIQSVDSSNTVNGKPIYYWVGVKDITVPADAGYVCLVMCANITVENLSLANNGEGILLAQTRESRIINNRISACSTGIRLEKDSNENTIQHNRINDCSDGIRTYSVSNNRINDNQIIGNTNGIYFEQHSSNNFVSYNSIRDNKGNAIYLSVSTHNRLSENIITDNGNGITLADYNCKVNVISRNSLENSKYGIRVKGSQMYPIHCTIIENMITNCTQGIYVDYTSCINVTENVLYKNGEAFRLVESENVVLRGNNLIENNMTFIIEGNSVRHFRYDVNTSNTVNYNPVYYWVGVRDAHVPLDAGYVFLVECSNITVENLQITDDFQGVVLLYTEKSIIRYNTFSRNYADGIKLWESNNNTIVGNTVTNNNGWGIQLSKSSNNVIEENSVTNNTKGILIQDSSDNKVNKNIISENNNWGISLIRSSVNSATENIVTENYGGIQFESATNNMLSENILNRNNYGISITGYGYMNDMDESNMINGKPVCYWIGVKGATVPSDAGFVALVNCTNITVQHMELSSNSHGILLAFTTDSMVKLNSFTGNSAVGVGIYQSSRNTVSENYITNNGWGIEVGDSLANEIIGNTITENNGWGIRFTGSQKDNIIYHNNFVNNKVTEGLQVSIDKRYGRGLGNIWDNGSEGNYWSDYTTRYPNATQIEGTQIGNTVFYINENNQDNYPMLTQTVIPEFSSTALVVILLTLVSIGSVTYKRKLTKN